MTTTPTHLTLTQAAERLGLGPRTIRRYIADGKLTGYRIGDGPHVRLLAAEVDALLQPIPTVRNLPPAA
jgi:excisionase family DNA binding protein